MVELAHERDLATETFGAHGHAEVAVQDLDGHAPVELPVVGEVHGGHAAASDLTLDVVAVGKIYLEFVENRLRGHVGAHYDSGYEKIGTLRHNY